MALKSFKAYDIRGRMPDELNVELAERIGRAFAKEVGEGVVVVGYDIRKDSPALAAALSEGLNRAGCDVIDIGLCGTEEVYFQTFYREVAGGIMVTASHNPMDYNGMKLVRHGARPISGDSGLRDIERLVEENRFVDAERCGSVTRDHDKAAYISHLLGYINIAALRPLRVVVNAGNGCAGPVLDLLSRHLPFEFIRVNHDPDCTFPNGIPNPLLPENRSATADAVRIHCADFGLAWDGDFDRCFFFDGEGNFIEGYYIVGLLAAQLLARNPGATVIHDPRLTWNTIDMVRDAGGVPIQSKTGHAFIKERMRADDAIYGGEMSAHHYFRDFAYCDSGMIPWLLLAERVSKSGQSLGSLVSKQVTAFPCSGEINFSVNDVCKTVDHIMAYFANQEPAVENVDGISADFGKWRFNLRASNTEPLLRLNVESKGDVSLMKKKTQLLSDLIRQMQG
ncbi:MAG: phosphomannomutase [Dyella sp.]|uniref:phosphomannomutase n=1 Tax=Dyella sp. TaxID=1869338 RepID=UPI003F80C337